MRHSTSGKIRKKAVKEELSPEENDEDEEDKEIKRMKIFIRSREGPNAFPWGL